MFLFLCTKLFQKRGHYSRGDIIQGGDIFQGNTVGSFASEFFQFEFHECQKCKNYIFSIAISKLDSWKGEI